MFVTLSGIATLLKAVQSANVLAGIVARPRPIVTLVRSPQPSQTPVPMLVTLSGIDTLVRPLAWRAPAPMFVTLDGIDTLVRP